MQKRIRQARARLFATQGLFLLTMIVVAGLYAGCEESGVEATTDKTLSAQKFIPTNDSLYREAVAIARRLSQYRTWITPQLVMNIPEAGIPITQIDPTLPPVVTWIKTQYDSNGSPYFDTVTADVKLEILNPGLLQLALIPTQNYGVIPDPDRFVGRDAIGGYYQVVSEMSNGTATPITLFHPNDNEATRSNAIDALEFPVFIVVFEQQSASPPSGPASKAAVGKYVVVNEIKLKTKQDNSNDEFELYVTEEGYNINSTTSWKFDGGSRADAKGGSNKTFRDVNGKSTYTMASDIYLYNLTGVTVRMVAIEDDDDPGVIDRGSGTETKSIKHYRASTNTNMSNDWIFNITRVSFFCDPDDYYSESGVDKINETNMTARLNGRTYFNTNESENTVLKDVEYKLGMKQ